MWKLKAIYRILFWKSEILTMRHPPAVWDTVRIQEIQFTVTETMHIREFKPFQVKGVVLMNK